MKVTGIAATAANGLRLADSEPDVILMDVAPFRTNAVWPQGSGSSSAGRRRRSGRSRRSWTVRSPRRRCASDSAAT
jgi:hypothetical protein